VNRQSELIEKFFELYESFADDKSIQAEKWLLRMIYSVCLRSLGEAQTRKSFAYYASARCAALWRRKSVSRVLYDGVSVSALANEFAERNRFLPYDKRLGSRNISPGAQHKWVRRQVEKVMFKIGPQRATELKAHIAAKRRRK
jgi:hypothetical protein